VEVKDLQDWEREKRGEKNNGLGHPLREKMKDSGTDEGEPRGPWIY